MASKPILYPETKSLTIAQIKRSAITVYRESRKFDNWQLRFFSIWFGQAISLLGSQLVQFALIWYLTERTGSATVLAFASLMGMLPQIIMSPFAGALVDRWHRQSILILADTAIALATLILAFLFAMQIVAVWHIYLLLFIRSLAGSFHWTAMQASTTLLVPEEYLARVVGINQTLQGIANIIIPPLGAVFLLWLPMQMILGIDIATALIAIVPLLFLSIPQPKMAQTKTSVFADIAEGISYLRKTPGILLLSAQGILIRLLMIPAVAMLPLLVLQHFNGDAIHLAAMQLVSGIGMVIGGLILGIWGGFNKRVVTAMLALIIDGLAIWVIGIVPSNGLFIAIVALFCAAVVEPIMLGTTFALAQSIIPENLQGRVFGLLSAFGTAMVPIGLALAGPVADTFGVQIWFTLGGIITILMGITAFFIPAIMTLEQQKIIV